MLWPQSVHVRMNPAFASQLLDVVATCSNEEKTIADFPEYGFKLDASQRRTLDELATQIVASFDSDAPIAAVAIVGHADAALRVPPGERKAKEQQISASRSRHALEQLMEAITRRPGGREVAAKLNFKSKAIGNTQPVVANATTEAQMRQNRRVVFKLARCTSPPIVIIHPPIPFPPRTPPEDNPNDANIVFAGTRFRLKIMGGDSVGEVGGVSTFQLAIWDIDNRRLALYSYVAVIGTVGVPPITSSGESGFSDIFNTPVPIQVDQFGGRASHDAAAALLVSGIKFRLKGGELRPLAPPIGVGVSLSTGPAKAVSLESGGGVISLVSGSVIVFDGPPK